MGIIMMWKPGFESCNSAGAQVPSTKPFDVAQVRHVESGNLDLVTRSLRKLDGQLGEIIPDLDLVRPRPDVLRRPGRPAQGLGHEVDVHQDDI
jgi:hypothetical protein